jgi:hypothetical protein
MTPFSDSSVHASQNITEPFENTGRRMYEGKEVSSKKL